jgi:diguanylate cyclase (GGDEF)-like protein
MSAEHHDSVILDDAAGKLDVVTEIRRKEALLKAGALQNAIFNSANFSSIATDERGVIQIFNVGAERMLGYTAADVVNKITPADISDPQEVIARAEALSTELGTPITPGFEALVFKAARGIEDIYELTYIRKDGSRFPAVVSVTALRDAQEQIIGYLLIGTDNTARKQAEEALLKAGALQNAIFNSANFSSIATDAKGVIQIFNVGAEHMLGYAAADVMNKITPADISDPQEVIARAEALSTELGIPITPGFEALVFKAARGIEDIYELTYFRKDGSRFPAVVSVTALRDAQEQIIGYLLIGTDNTARRKAEEALREAGQRMALQMTHSAQHDFLTGLPNRMLLNDRVSQAIALASRHLKKVAVLFLDLDGFKHINDSLGHPIGDKVLQSIAKRLLDCGRVSDTVSRQGGDEFVVLLSEVEHPEDAAITAKRMLQAVAEAYSIGQHDLHVTASIGVSVYPDDGLDAESLIKNADTAMYQAKENGPQSYQFFKPAMNVRAVERQSTEESLRRALERQEFALHYQPKINLKTGEIAGAEALLRWMHPIRGPVSPAQFIPVAEDCGLILPIGNWVLREACKQARAWVDAGLTVTTMAVNISAMQFRDENFLEGVFAILEDTGMDPRSLELELTESVLMKHAESTESILKTLRAKGVQFAVDDFGTGYSSLSYLRKFPIDALKIDQSFVRQITTAPGETNIVTAVISMGRSLKLRVVAEGVETHEELAFLQAHQCDEAQGYYFSRPVPPQQFAKLLETGISETLLN